MNIFKFGAGLFIAVCFTVSIAQLHCQDSGSAVLRGTVHDAAGLPSRDAVVSVADQHCATDDEGHYVLRVPRGTRLLEVQTENRAAFRVKLAIDANRTFDIDLSPSDIVTVTADREPLTPDPATQGYAHADLVDANPGRPGVPLSLPGYPAETASGGIKAPQYFAPGVAGDHGEPIAQYLDVAEFLLPNNLTANAHGNGYADPNFLVAGVLGGVIVDGGAFNTRYGDHAVNLAVTYELQPGVPTTVQTSTTGKDVAVGSTWRLDPRVGWPWKPCSATAG